MAPNRQFGSRVQHVEQGSPVSAGNVGRTTRQLEQRTNYIGEALEAMEAGRLLIHRDQTVDPDLLVGQPVYWNAENQRYEAALAAVENDEESGTLVPKDSSDCTGLILEKTSANLATIGLVGLARFQSLANAIDGAIVPGRYYLSAAEPGKLVKQRPPITVAVCFVLGPLNECDEDTWVFILPQMRDFMEDHIHYRFELEPVPAGTHSSAGALANGFHEITDADSTIKGWLPADDAVFDGLAPTGAKFGYNLQAHPELDRVWPPVPLEGSVMFWDKGENLVGATEIPTKNEQRLCRLDKHGIWWMSDCYADVPWPKDYDNVGSSAVSLGSSDSSESGCPRSERMRVILAFLHMIFATDKTVVTSLQPAEGQPLEYVNCDGEVARTGDLYSRIVIELLKHPDEYYGGEVLKEIVSGKLQFGCGWVAEGVVGLSDRVTLTSTRQRGLDPTKPISSTNPAVHQGIIQLDVNLEPTERELNPQIIYLGDALEREHKGVAYIGFPQDRDSGIRMRYNIAPAGLPVNPKFKIRAMIFGRLDGPFSALALGYYRIVRPVDGTPTEITEGDTALTFDVVTPSGSLTADHAIEVESEEFTIAAGDTVIVDLSRAAAATPAYDDDVGIIRVGGIVIPGT